MKGFSIPNISIPKVSIPDISFSGSKIDSGAIRNAINSAIPDISNFTEQIDLEGIASKMISENANIELPEELKSLISK